MYKNSYNSGMQYWISLSIIDINIQLEAIESVTFVLKMLRELRILFSNNKSILVKTKQGNFLRPASSVCKVNPVTYYSSLDPGLNPGWDII